ncbi:MAG: DUF1549 domain-containing protein, partial [Armatimonadetes bacterium]|nr:DUF1549 domain-containing protein [Armatimonadota bacterium]
MRFRLALLAALLLGAAPAAAKPSYPQVLREEYGPGLARSLQDCTTCHVAPGERPVFNAALPRPHNVFGARLAELEKSLREAGKPADLVTRLALVRREDADRDGATNDLELLTGHFPGRRTDRPGPGEAKRYGALRAALERARGWVWRPFEPVKRPAPPTGANRKWIRNPVDAFVAEEHTRRGLQPRPEAPREVLLRRAYLDLIGTPPTPAERAAFLADLAPGAYERVVDRLLASPMYGERWGRHWMDVWRYSDWDGYAA